MRVNFFKLSRICFSVFAVGLLLSMASCGHHTSDVRGHAQPVWINAATLYEVNVRQYTPEGTFTAFEQHLPRLKDIGVDILWFMPIHPIGLVERKGTLGSYYSVRDYYGVNPEFGTLDDFKSVVAKAHNLGMKVIIDVVANHTSRDAVLFIEHPDWYIYKDGVPNAPFDWSDVAELDYNKPEVRKYMIDMLKYWVTVINVDGFRCDVAAEVPDDFWVEARKELDSIKPVFMLAEAERPQLVEFAFVADYGWECHHIMNGICKEEKNADDFARYLAKKDTVYPKGSFKMNFITNHDENSWNGTEFERMGDAVKTFATLTFAIDGMPLIYSGQEVGWNKRLQFFEKENIDWSDSLGMTPFYTKLIRLKKDFSVLGALNGSALQRVYAGANKDVLAFVRADVSSGQKLLFVFNLSANPQQVAFEGDDFIGSYTEYFTGEHVNFARAQQLSLDPWAYRVYIK